MAMHGKIPYVVYGTDMKSLDDVFIILAIVFSVILSLGTVFGQSFILRVDSLLPQPHSTRLIDP